MTTKITITVAENEQKPIVIWLGRAGNFNLNVIEPGESRDFHMHAGNGMWLEEANEPEVLELIRQSKGQS